MRNGSSFNTLRRSGRAKELSDIVTRLQGLEERKLRFTVDHQLALQEVKEHPDDELQVMLSARQNLEMQE